MNCYRAVDGRGGVMVVESHAARPAEISTSLAAARAAAAEQGRRVLVAFQPGDVDDDDVPELGEALAAADLVVVFPCPATTNTGVVGSPSQRIADAVIVNATMAGATSDTADGPRIVASRAQPGDVVVAIGHGDIAALSAQLLRWLPTRSAPASP